MSQEEIKRKEEIEQAAIVFQDSPAEDNINTIADFFVCGAEWSDEHPRKGLVDIEKVCEWLKENATYIHPRIGKKTCIVNLNRFKEAFY